MTLGEPQNPHQERAARAWAQSRPEWAAAVRAASRAAGGDGEAKRGPGQTYSGAGQMSFDHGKKFDHEHEDVKALGARVLELGGALGRLSAEGEVGAPGASSSEKILLLSESGNGILYV